MVTVSFLLPYIWKYSGLIGHCVAPGAELDFCEDRTIYICIAFAENQTLGPLSRKLVFYGAYGTVTVRKQVLRNLQVNVLKHNMWKLLPLQPN